MTGQLTRQMFTHWPSAPPASVGSLATCLLSLSIEGRTGCSSADHLPGHLTPAPRPTAKAPNPDGQMVKGTREAGGRTMSGGTTDLSLKVSPELLEAIAQRTAEILRETSEQEDRWMNLDEAVDYLRCKRSRLYEFTRRGEIPHSRDGRRLLFRRSELDQWVRDGGAKRIGR